MTRQPPVRPSVPRAWPGETIVCLGTGPSLSEQDVAYCRGRARVIAIKQAVRLAPWADALYSGEKHWWKTEGAISPYAGARYAIDPGDPSWGAIVLRNTGFTGLERDPSGLRTGKNSGYQAINLAVHLGASRIVLLGYDMQPGPGQVDHFFGQHAHGGRPALRHFLPLFDTLVKPLGALGVRIVNASRRTALTCFQQVSLEEALA